MEKFDVYRTCPQGCSASVSNRYHGVPKDAIEQQLKCTAFELPHMHRECAGCTYEWAETPVA